MSESSEKSKEPEETSAFPGGKAASFLLVLLLQAYGLPAFFAVPYFNYQYARDHGFIEWVTLGELTATLEGLAWPYFVLKRYNQSSPPREESESRAEREFEKWKLVNAAVQRHDGTMPPIHTSGDYVNFLNGCSQNTKFLERLHDIIEAGRALDISFLNSLYPELGDKFRSVYIESYKALDEGCRSASVVSMDRFDTLSGQWLEWSDNNSRGISDAWSKALSAARQPER